MNMKYIISESRLQDIFDMYMDTQYGLTYNWKEREFRTERGDIFGDLWRDNRFYFAYDSDPRLLKSMFDNSMYKLMLNYLRNRFPELEIDGIE